MIVTRRDLHDDRASGLGRTAFAAEHTHGQSIKPPINADRERKLKETGSSSAQRARPAKRKCPENGCEQPAKRMQRVATPASSIKAGVPAEGCQTAGKAKTARGKQGKSPATGHQSKASKWAMYMSSPEPAEHAQLAPSGQGGKHKQRECTWDGLTADDMLQRLQGALECFEGAKASYSILSE